MRRLPPIALLLAFVLAPAVPAGAAPYSVYLVRPAGPDDVARVRGPVELQARVDGLGGPSTVAYELSEIGRPWDQEGAVLMTPNDEGVFTATMHVEETPNGRYRLRVRAWGGSGGEYDPEDDGTYATDGIELELANPPPTPEGIAATGGAGELSATWTDIDSTARSDFAGYEVYLALAGQDGACAPFGDVYSLRETTFDTEHTEGGLPPAVYCIRVRALRTAPGTATIASPPTEAVLAPVAEGSGEGGSGDPGDGGEYTPGLPYDPATEVTPIPGGEPVSGPEALEAGTTEGRNRWAFMAGGLALAILAILLRRYVRTVPDR